MNGWIAVLFEDICSHSPPHFIRICCTGFGISPSWELNQERRKTSNLMRRRKRGRNSVGRKIRGWRRERRRTQTNRRWTGSSEVERRPAADPCWSAMKLYLPHTMCSSFPAKSCIMQWNLLTSCTLLNFQHQQWSRFSVLQSYYQFVPWTVCDFTDAEHVWRKCSPRGC